MTKIPNVEEVKKMGLQKKQGQVTVYCYTQTQLENILINQRTALLTELREYVDQVSYYDDCDCHVLDYDNIQGLLDELINPSV